MGDKLHGQEGNRQFLFTDILRWSWLLYLEYKVFKKILGTRSVSQMFLLRRYKLELFAYCRSSISQKMVSLCFLWLLVYESVSMHWYSQQQCSSIIYSENGLVKRVHSKRKESGWTSIASADAAYLQHCLSKTCHYTSILHPLSHFNLKSAYILCVGVSFEDTASLAQLFLQAKWRLWKDD